MSRSLLDELPEELVVWIAEWLTPKALLALGGTSRRLRETCHTPTQWQRLCLNVNAVARGLSGATVREWQKHYHTLLRLPQWHHWQNKWISTAEFSGRRTVTITCRCDRDTTLQSYRVFEPGSLPLYYFEVHLERLDTASTISVGFSFLGFATFYRLENHPYVYAWRGQDAHKVHSSTIGLPVPGHGQWREGEVIGCGFREPAPRAVFFTRNGRFVGDFFMLPVRGLGIAALCPSVGMFGTGQRVTVNYGAVPFRFDLRDLPASLEPCAAG
eukprot:TRINITY_DN3763_c0_g1_i1.p1 TRINITY_DN3763_c0_g1~~TRINITY_DN3763_c0_g1_i1.p1  ORF type:complete len:287 (+),score=26.57 TRINITY_DN3763_c0_g1_i1:49-861(+)